MTKALLAATVLLLVGSSVPAQNYDSALSRYSRQNPEEKIYIHYDRDNYVAGETIWFKAYLYNLDLPSTLSVNFYLQVTDQAGNVVTKRQYPVQGASVKGSLALPDSLPQGYYFVRALTKAMVNSATKKIYTKELYVFNPLKKQSAIPESRNKQELNLTFYPESGKLIAGVQSTVAFQALDARGYPVEVSGRIIGDDGTYLATFKSIHDGMGRFKLKPKVGVKYYARIFGATGVDSVMLPTVQSSGISISVDNEKGGKVFQISKSANSGNTFSEVLLVARQYDQIVYENLINFGSYTSVKGHLTTDNLPSGILQFTLFDTNGLPVSDRLSFVNNTSATEKGSIKVTKKDLANRGENTFEVSFPDSMQRIFSVTVSDYTAVPGRADNIISRLLFTEELKGHVFDPAWYFTGNSAVADTALDNVMLTHTGSRFNWTDALADRNNKMNVTDNYLLSVTGNVVALKDKKPVSKGSLDVDIVAEDSTTFFYSVPVDDAGKFRVDSLLINGKSKFYFTYLDDRNKEKAVEVTMHEHQEDTSIMNAFSRKIPDDIILNPPPTVTDQVLLQRLEFVKEGNPVAKVLENVTIKAADKSPEDVVNEKYTSEIFRTGGKVVVDNVNEKVVDRNINGLDFVKNRIADVGLQGGTFVNRKNFSIQNHKDADKMRNKEDMRMWEVGLFINEVPANLLQLKNLRAEQIALVKFYQAGFIGAGSNYPGGAIAVYLKKGDDMVNIKPVDAGFITYDGYSLVKEFKSPDYSRSAQSSTPDKRSTLLWNPDAGANGNLSFRFFNNDFSRKLRIVVEGFDANGGLIHIEHIMSNENDN